jgi:hypothetical protein
VYLMSERSGEQTVILTTILWWQKLGRDWQWINKQPTDFIWKCTISRNWTRYKVKSSIGLKTQIGSQLWKLRNWGGY